MQQGGSQYGVPPPPELARFPSGAPATRSQLLGGIPGPEHLQAPQQQQPMAEAVSPISSRPPSSAQPANFEELAPTVSGNFHDEEALVAGEEAERGIPGNRWPREETLALIKIRSDMDATFRDATLKGPLWEDVSRKLGEQGYKRSAKKCKEKFENVHKYYKRTKEGRAGRQDGKSYRFFSQLEALHNSTAIASSSAAVSTNPPSTTGFGVRYQPAPLSSVAPRPVPEPAGGAGASTPRGGAVGVSFSTNSSSSSPSETDGEETEEAVGEKRKRRGRKTMGFLKDLMKQLMDQQEAMQQRFLETIEKREQDRMIREEAWKRQEMARLTREHDAIAQERAASATRDSAIIAFLQKITGQTIQLPHPIPVPIAPTPITTPAPPPPPPQPPIQQKPQQQQRRAEPPRSQPESSELILVPEQQQEGGIGSSSTDPASSRWPKSEVHALIKLRSGLDSRYQDAGPKGPLWEEISAGMQQMGYSRSAKRCKEKWENINKYFKKVKESNKKRPEDAKTCPYFHQLDALYRKKNLPGGGTSSGNSGTQTKQEQEPNPNSQLRTDVFPISTMPPPPPSSADKEKKNADGDNGRGNNGGTTVQTSNGDVRVSFFEKGSGTGGDTTAKKPEDIMKELIMERHQAAAVEDYDKDSDNMDEDEDEDEEEQKMAYKIEFQRPNVGGSSNGSANPSAAAAAAAATAGSFLAMVQ